MSDPEELRGFLEGESDLSATELVQEVRGKNVVHESRIRRVIEKWEGKMKQSPSVYHQSDVPLVLDDLRELLSSNDSKSSSEENK